MSLIASDFLWVKDHFSRPHLRILADYGAANRAETGMTESEYYFMLELAGERVNHRRKVRHKKRK
jgi:hypothetical protein